VTTQEATILEGIGTDITSSGTIVSGRGGGKLSKFDHKFDLSMFEARALNLKNLKKFDFSIFSIF